MRPLYMPFKGASTMFEKKNIFFFVSINVISCGDLYGQFRVENHKWENFGKFSRYFIFNE